MTICIGALCENGLTCVVAADREMTAPGLSLEFEHHERKIDRLSDTCVVLSAGDALLATEIIGRMSSPSTSRVMDFAMALPDTFQAVHLDRVDHVLLPPASQPSADDKDRQPHDEVRV